MTIAKEPRRHLMNMAWRLYRGVPAADGRSYRVAPARPGARRFMKRLIAKKAGRSAFRSPVAGSAIARRYGRTALVGGRASAAYLTTHVGG